MVWKLKYQTPIHWLTRIYLLSYSLTFLLQRNHKEKKNLELLKKKKKSCWSVYETAYETLNKDHWCLDWCLAWLFSGRVRPLPKNVQDRIYWQLFHFTDEKSCWFLKSFLFNSIQFTYVVFSQQIFEVYNSECKWITQHHSVLELKGTLNL